MGSPITFSGFNNIDFNLILNAVMEQERRPLLTLQARQSALQFQESAFGTLATKLAAVEAASDTLAGADAFGGRAVSSTDDTALTAGATSATPLGTYDVIVNELARAQVTASNSAHADKDTTAVATGGSLTIGGIVVTVASSVTLEELASAINGTADIGVTATVVSPSSGSYQLVLTGTDTGQANAFTVTNALTGGTAPVTFIDTDFDGESGDSAADNAVQAPTPSWTSTASRSRARPTRSRTPFPARRSRCSRRTRRRRSP